MNGNLVEVGQRIEVDGKGYWITKVTGVCLEVMPDPDDAPRKARSNFWPTFWVIALIIVIVRMVF